MRIHSVASRTVAQALVDLATDSEWAASPSHGRPPWPEIAGPQAENLVAALAGPTFEAWLDSLDSHDANTACIARREP
jgi:hypothetical protein